MGIDIGGIAGERERRERENEEIDKGTMGIKEAAIS